MKFDTGQRGATAPPSLVRGPPGAGASSLAASNAALPTGRTSIDRMAATLPRVSALRTVDRVIHARNAGAYGFFEAYGRVGSERVDRYTRAALFRRAGERSPLFARFSTVAHGGHGPETVRDPRGFSMRFHTEDGRWDFIGSSLPVSFVRDSTLFPSVAHAFRPEPITHRLNPQRIFEFIRYTPCALNMVTWLFSSWGIPAHYRAMCGFAAGTWINDDGALTHVRYHLVPKGGPLHLSQTDADALQARNFNHATQDLHAAISSGDAPEWEMSVQLIPVRDDDTLEDGRLDFDPLDPTIVWPRDRYPLRAIGRVVLDRNPRNYFADVEQVRFDPAALVDGMASADGASPGGDRRDTASTRADELQQLMRGRAASNAPCPAGLAGSVGRASRSSMQGVVSDANHRHAGDTYRAFDPTQQDELVRNLVTALRACDERVQAHMVEHFRACDADYGRRIAAGLDRLH